MKLYDFQRIQGKKEVYYESVTLSIWSITEVSIGIVVANLPPLRKYFDAWLMAIIPASLRKHMFSSNDKSSGRDGQGYAMPTYGSQLSRRMDGRMGKGREGRVQPSADDESDRAILEELESEGGGQKFNGIMRT